MATLNDVANKCGVTVTTVSRMLNNRGYVSEKTRTKILEAMKELNYQPNEIARALSLKRTNVIGLIVPSVKNLYFCKIVDAIEHYATLNGYKLMLCTSNHEVDKEVEYIDMLKSNKVTGIIIASRTMNFDKYINTDAPIVAIDKNISKLIPSVNSDNFQGGVLAAEHLIQKGCRNLAYIRGSINLNMDANLRYEGFKFVCDKEKLDIAVKDATEEAFYLMEYTALINKVLDENPDLDGIFTSNDIIAAQVIQCCVERGKRVPEDIKIVGYDDIELASFTTPTITTIHQPVEDMCRHAVETIINKANNVPVPSVVTFPVELVVRQSTE